MIVCESWQGCLHFHAPITGVLNPYVLQQVIHSPAFQAAIASVYDSMIRAELPPHLHIEQLLAQKLESDHKDEPFVDSVNQAAIPPHLASEPEFEGHANRCGLCKQMHLRTHTNSCVSQHLPYCRFCMRRVMVKRTGARLIIPTDHGVGAVPRYTFETAPVPEPLPSDTADIYGCPIPCVDTLPIAFEIQRRNILDIMRDDGLQIADDFDIIDCLDCNLLKDLDPQLKDKIRHGLSKAERATLKAMLLQSNVWVSEFNTCCMACIPSNEAMLPMGLGRLSPCFAYFRVLSKPFSNSQELRPRQSSFTAACIW